MMKKPIVAHSVSPFVALTENWIYHQIINLKDFDPIVLTTKRINNDIFPFDKVYSTESLSKWREIIEKGYRKIFRSYLPYWSKACMESDVKILHSHFGYHGWQDLGLARKLGLPHIVSFYGVDMSKTPIVKPKWYDRYIELFDKIGFVITEGPYARKTIIELGCPPEKAMINRLGVDLDKIPFKARRLMKNETPKILVASRFTETKGIPYAVEAFASVLKDNPNIKMTIVGDANENYEQQIEKKKILGVIEKCNIKGEIDLLGYVPHEELLKISYGHHIFLAPSVTSKDGETEGGSPVILTEMVASGMPVIATKHADIPEVVSHGKNGLLVQERNADSLSKALIGLLKKPDLWEEMGAAGREHVAQRFNVETQVGKLEGIYQRMLNL